MNFLVFFFHFKVLIHTKHLTPNAQLSVFSHPNPPASFVIKPSWSTAEANTSIFDQSLLVSRMRPADYN